MELTQNLCKCGCEMSVTWNTRKKVFNSYLKGHFSKKYQFNNDLFDGIESEQDAYWYGFFVADGFVNKKGTFGFDLSDVDIKHLEKFRDYAKSNAPITKRNGFCRLEISGMHLLPRLSLMGLVQGKSEHIGMPELTIELRNHFIRGVFDGDGWINYYAPQKSLSFGIIGNIGLMSGIQISLIEECGLSWTKLRNDKRKKAWVTTVAYGGNGNCSKIYDYLYDNASVFLERKHDRWRHHLVNYQTPR